MADIPETERTKVIIDVLLHDYDAMRAEIVSRTSSRFQLVGLTAVAATLATANWAHGWDVLWVILGTVGFGAIIWFIFRLFINRCAARVLQIEDEINNMLKTSRNDPTLIWESYFLHIQWWPFQGWAESKYAMRKRWDGERQRDRRAQSQMEDEGFPAHGASPSP
jgi:hypothetical protein